MVDSVVAICPVCWQCAHWRQTIGTAIDDEQRAKTKTSKEEKENMESMSRNEKNKRNQVMTNLTSSCGECQSGQNNEKHQKTLHGSYLYGG
jgi:hypothetical protein